MTADPSDPGRVRLCGMVTTTGGVVTLTDRAAYHDGTELTPALAEAAEAERDALRDELALMQSESP